MPRLKGGGGRIGVYWLEQHIFSIGSTGIPYAAMSIEPRFFEYRNHRIAWYGQGSGAVLILLHGWGSSAAAFDGLCAGLQDIRQCCRLDFPGFGRSEALKEPWGLDDYADLVIHWADHVLAERGARPDARSLPEVDLLVHSFGNRVMLRMLGRKGWTRPVGKVIVTGGAGLKPRRSVKTRAVLLLVRLLKFPSILLPGRLSDLYLARLRGSVLWNRLGSADYAKLSGPMRESFSKVVNDHLDDELDMAAREMLLLWGTHDTATPLWMGRMIEKQMPGSALIELDGAGHYAFLEQPGRFMAIVRSYLTS